MPTTVPRREKITNQKRQAAWVTMLIASYYCTSQGKDYKSDKASSLTDHAYNRASQRMGYKSEKASSLTDHAYYTTPYILPRRERVTHQERLIAWLTITPCLLRRRERVTHQKRLAAWLTMLITLPRRERVINKKTLY